MSKAETRDDGSEKLLHGKPYRPFSPRPERTRSGGYRPNPLKGKAKMRARIIGLVERICHWQGGNPRLRGSRNRYGLNDASVFNRGFKLAFPQESSSEGSAALLH